MTLFPTYIGANVKLHVFELTRSETRYLSSKTKDSQGPLARRKCQYPGLWSESWYRGARMSSIHDIYIATYTLYMFVWSLKDNGVKHKVVSDELRLECKVKIKCPYFDVFSSEIIVFKGCRLFEIFIVFFVHHRYNTQYIKRNIYF